MKLASFKNPATSHDFGRSRILSSELDQEIRRIGKLLKPRSGTIVTATIGLHDLTDHAQTVIGLSSLSDADRIERWTQLLGTVGSLPLRESSVQLIVCTGAINNWDPSAAIGEFARILCPGGYLLLGFGSSRSASLISDPAFGQSVAISQSNTAEHAAPWVYSARYLINLLRAADLDVLRRRPVAMLPRRHSVAPTGGFAEAIVRFDVFARNLRILNRWAAGQLLVCQKST